MLHLVSTWKGIPPGSLPYDVASLLYTCFLLGSTVPASSHQSLACGQHSLWKTGKFLWPSNCKQRAASAAEAGFVCSQPRLQPALSIFSLTLKLWMEQARHWQSDHLQAGFDHSTFHAKQIHN